MLNKVKAFLKWLLHIKKAPTVVIHKVEVYFINNNSHKD